MAMEEVLSNRVCGSDEKESIRKSRVRWQTWGHRNHKISIYNRYLKVSSMILFQYTQGRNLYLRC